MLSFRANLCWILFTTSLHNSCNLQLFINLAPITSFERGGLAFKILRVRFFFNLSFISFSNCSAASIVSPGLNFAQSFSISFHANPSGQFLIYVESISIIISSMSQSITVKRFIPMRFAFLFTMNWNSSGFILSNKIASFAGSISLNLAFNVGLTLFNAQTAVAFVNQTGKCSLSPLDSGICFKLTESMIQMIRFLSAFWFLFLLHQLSLLSFLK